MPLPSIQSALPKRRYQFGEFIITILSDIQTHDSQTYLYIAAILREGSTEPEVYITCEPISPASNNYRIKVITQKDEHIISEDSQWKHEGKFCDYALEGIQQMFQLNDETPVLLS